MEIYKTIHNPYRVVEMFEEEVANYTRASYAVAVSSCTEALFLCCVSSTIHNIQIPSRTYLSVPQSIIQADGNVIFDETRDDWKGIYRLFPTNIYDAAKRFTSDMYKPRTLMRYEGRNSKIYHEDNIKQMGYNMYMTPEQAARGLTLMRNIPVYNEDQIEEGGYAYLPGYTLFKDCEVIKKKELV